MPTKPQLVAAVLFAPNYQRKLLNLFGSSIISYIPDPFTGVDVSGHGYNGTPTAVTAATGPDGQRAGSFDGSTSFVDWYSAGLAGAFNPLEGTVLLWLKMGAGVWEDATTRYASVIYNSDNAGYAFRIIKTATTGQLSIARNSGGVIKAVTYASGSPAGWLAIGATWSESGDAFAVYANGPQTGSTQTGLGAWGANPISSTRTVIGAQTTGPLTPFSGALAHALLLNRPATAAEMLAAATI